MIISEIANQVLMPLSFRMGKTIVPPVIASLFLTKKCNSRCTICEYWKIKDFSDELTKEEWFRTIDELKKLGVKMINFTADGEILTRMDAFEIMEYAKKLSILFTLNTNGINLNNFINRIIQLNPFQVQVSLDTFSDKAYEKLRGIPGGFTNVKRGITALKEAGYEKISVGSVLTRDNLDDLPKLQQFCLENGFTYRVTAFQFEGFNVDNNKLRSDYRTEKFLLRLNEIVSKLKEKPINNTKQYLDSMKYYYTHDKYHPLNCIVGYYKIFILPDGDVSLCNIMHKNAVAGNVRKNSLRGIWYSSRADEIRKKIKRKECPSCWLSCFAEDNIRFSVKGSLRNFGYFIRKTKRIFR
jgi:radical SAM protein with 4Fe4S-binding SPASM domain